MPVMFALVLACAQPTITESAPTAHFSLPSTTVRSPMARVEDDGRVDVVTRLLTAVVTDHLRDVNNPWAVSHAIMALGPTIKDSAGEPLVDGIFLRYAQPVVVGKNTLIKFPAKRGRVRIEPHADLILKALTESGAAPSDVVSVQGETSTLAALYRHSLWRLDRMVADYDDIPWTLQALSGWAEPGYTWVNHQGHELSLDALTHDVATQLAKETHFLREPGSAPLQKRGQGIFQYTCGGAHLVQGVSWAVARGFGEPSDRQILVDSVDGWLLRLDFELKQIDAGLVSNPEYRLVLLIQRMKFLGHLVETLHKMAALGIIQPDGRVREGVYFAEEQLLLTVVKLAELGVFDNLSTISKNNEQMYFDVAGDAAHALRALNLARGATLTF